MFLSSSPSPPSPDSSTLLFPSRRYARCIGKAQRPSSDEATFSPSIYPSVHGLSSSSIFDRFSLRSIFERFSKISQNSKFHSNRKFETKISPFISPFIERIKLIVLLQLHHTPVRSSLFTHTDAQHEGDDFRILATSLSPLLRHETNALSAQSSSWFPPVRMTTIRMTITIEDDDSSQLSILARGGRAKLETRFSSRGNLRTDRNSSNARCFAI